MSKNYNAIDGLIKQTRECVTDAYNKGYKDGYKDGQVVTQQAFNATYEQGLEDAWEVAREVIRMDSTRQFEIFGEHGDINVLDLKSAKEAMKLYEEHKEKQKTVEHENTDWHDIPSDEMTLEQAKEAVKELRRELAIRIRI